MPVIPSTTEEEQNQPALNTGAETVVGQAEPVGAQAAPTSPQSVQPQIASNTASISGDQQRGQASAEAQQAQAKPTTSGNYTNLQQYIGANTLEGQTTDINERLNPFQGQFETANTQARDDVNTIFNRTADLATNYDFGGQFWDNSHDSMTKDKFQDYYTIKDEIVNPYQDWEGFQGLDTIVADYNRELNGLRDLRDSEGNLHTPTADDNSRRIYNQGEQSLDQFMIDANPAIQGTFAPHEEKIQDYIKQFNAGDVYKQQFRDDALANDPSLTTQQIDALERAQFLSKAYGDTKQLGDVYSNIFHDDITADTTGTSFTSLESKRDSALEGNTVASENALQSSWLSDAKNNLRNPLYGLVEPQLETLNIPGGLGNNYQSAPNEDVLDSFSDWSNFDNWGGVSTDQKQGLAGLLWDPALNPNLQNYEVGGPNALTDYKSDTGDYVPSSTSPNFDKEWVQNKGFGYGESPSANNKYTVPFSESGAFDPSSLVSGQENPFESQRDVLQYGLGVDGQEVIDDYSRYDDLMEGLDLSTQDHASSIGERNVTSNPYDFDYDSNKLQNIIDTVVPLYGSRSDITGDDSGRTGSSFGDNWLEAATAQPDVTDRFSPDEFQDRVYGGISPVNSLNNQRNRIKSTLGYKDVLLDYLKNN